MATQEVLIEEFIKQINKYYNTNLIITEWPDKVNRTTKEIDAIAETERLKIAIEHTSIDVLPNERRDDSRFYQIVGGLRNELINKLKFRVTIIIPSYSITKGYDYKKVRENLKNWLLKNVPTLTFGSKTILADGIPFEFEIKKEKSGRNKIAIGRDVPLDNTFVDRLSYILNEKSQKLQRYEKEDYKTVILVENSNIQLMSEDKIYNAVHSRNSKFSKNSVDEIWFADTSIENSFEFWLLNDRNKKSKINYAQLLN
ncbi:MAG: hypothetical protein K8R79_10640 [Calditrichales bacterium]|nr:hypothetical protein [Calditrichales bacterium]